MVLVSTSRTYFFSKGTLRIKKNSFEFFPMNLLTYKYSSTVYYHKLISYIEDGTVCSFLAVLIESLEDFRGGLIVYVDEKVLIWIRWNVRSWKIRAPTSSVIRTGSEADRAVRLRRTVRADRMEAWPDRTFFNIFEIDKLFYIISYMNSPFYYFKTFWLFMSSHINFLAL